MLIMDRNDPTLPVAGTVMVLRYVFKVCEALRSFDSDATKTLVSQRKPELVPKKISRKRPGTHAHQRNTLREMTRLVRQSTVGDTAAPRLGRDGRDGCRMPEAEWMKPVEGSYLQAGQSISTIVTSRRDVSCSKTATR